MGEGNRGAGQCQAPLARARGPAATKQKRQGVSTVATWTGCEFPQQPTPCQRVGMGKEVVSGVAEKCWHVAQCQHLGLAPGSAPR
jgi:hypothetical protein